LQNPQAAALKNGAFNCVQAVVTKGMPDNQCKLDMIQQINFLPIIEHFQIVNKDLDIETAEDDEFKSEEEFFHLVASSINRLGIWCLDSITENVKFRNPEFFN
jgi:hypothetical protein